MCQELVARGHEVTLFAAPGSHSDARLRTPLEAAHPHEIGSSMVESDCVACAWGEIDLAAELGPAFDVVHDHSGFTALAMADRIAAPVVHTIHGAFVEETAPFYRRHGHKARLVAISRSQALSAPARVRIADVVPNPVVVERWPLRTEKQDYLLWVGRMDPVKGAHRAIRAARLAGRRLVLAGPCPSRTGAALPQVVEPQIDNVSVRYIGEVGGVEKLGCACFAARAVHRLDSIDAADCRASVAARYGHIDHRIGLRGRLPAGDPSRLPARGVGTAPGSPHTLPSPPRSALMLGIAPSTRPSPATACIGIPGDTPCTRARTCDRSRRWFLTRG